MTMKNEEVSRRTLEILSKPYARRLVPDETGGYVASIQEFPGCVAEGDTPQEAIQNLDKAAASWVEVALSNGYEIREPVSFYGFSGKIALRIPRGLHKQVAEIAELEDSSINQLLVTAIANYAGNKQAFKECSEVFVSEVRKVISDGLFYFYRNGPSSFTIAMQPNRGGYLYGSTVSDAHMSDALIGSEVIFPGLLTKPYQKSLHEQ
jgi:predicted RNase H-like HicB family nuclease